MMTYGEAHATFIVELWVAAFGVGLLPGGGLLVTYDNKDGDERSVALTRHGGGIVMIDVDDDEDDAIKIVAMEPIVQDREIEACENMWECVAAEAVKFKEIYRTLIGDFLTTGHETF